MKYIWENMTDEDKMAAITEEMSLATHNGTTKDDFIEIMKFLDSKLKRAESRKAPNISDETMEEFYKFLQGEVPKPFHIDAVPNLSPEQAFSVIYYLQEGPRVLPDKYEKCRAEGCDTLFDSENEGCLALYCDGCGCQHPNDFDPDEDEDGCCGCPIVLGEDEHVGGCEGCKEQGKDSCSCIDNPVPVADI